MATLFRKLFLLTVLLAAVNACKEDDPGVEQEEEHVGEVTPVGAALGDAESFSIGPEGGVIDFADGLIQVNIPQGALTTATSIQVESVENTCSAGIGTSFRLVPHGLQFETPVTISFSYEHVPVSFEDGLAIAYQADDGIWYWPGNLERDKNQKTVSVQTTHFSDWTLFESMHLAPQRAEAEPNEEIELIAFRYLPENEISLLAPLVPTSDPISLGEAVRLETKFIKDWSLIGDGTLRPSGSSAMYQAPATIPDENPVTISLEIDLRNGSKAFLLSNIIVGTMHVTLNGGPYSNLTIAANNPGTGGYVADKNTSFIGFSGLDKDGNAIAVQIFFPGNEKGQFSWNDTNCMVVTNHNIGTAIVAGVSVIPSDPPSIHPGYVKITEFGEVGATISGTFEGNFTYTDYRCQIPCIEYGTVKGMFTVPRFQ